MGYEANRVVETSAKTFAVIEHLADTEAIGVSALARELEMSKGIVHNHLSTLRELGYVTKNEDGYRLTPNVLHLGHRVRATSQFYRHGHTPVDRLSTRFETTAFLVQRHGTDSIVVHTARVPSMPTVETGERAPLPSSLAGIAMLSCRSEAERDELLETSGGSIQYPVDAIVETVTEQGYVTGPMRGAESRDGVAVPIVDDDQRCRSGIGAFLPDGDDAAENRLIEEIVAIRNRIERRFVSEWDAERTFATEKHSWFSS